MFAIGIGDVSTDELEEIASEPTKKYTYTADDYTNLKKIRNKVRWGICRETKTKKDNKKKGRYLENH